MKPEIEKLRHLRSELIEAMKSFSLNKVIETLFDRWTLKDIVGHLSGWDIYTINAIHGLKKSQLVEWGLPLQKFNLKSVSDRRSNSWKDVLEEFVLVSQQLIEEYMSLTEYELSSNFIKGKKYTPSQFLKIDVDHYQEHLDIIKKKIKSL